MAASRKLYIALAESLRRHAAEIHNEQLDPLLKDIMDDLKTDNPQFDKVKFYDAVYRP